jgi:GT2 family glycosyltransferase
MITLSVVIPSHNRADLLQACLASVARHAPPGTQVVVVDDGSPGGQVAAVANGFTGVEVVRLPRRMGFCAAANAGIRAARGAIVEMLNDDTEVTEGWAAAALRAFRDGAVAAVAPLVLYWPDGQRVDSAGDRYYVGGVAGKRGHGEPLCPEHLRPGPVFGASASSAFYRRAALVRVGAFPESFGAYFEDVDLAFRLHRAGYRIWFEPAARVLHHVSASYGPPRRDLVERQSRNEEQVYWRNLPAGALARAWPAHLVVLAAKAWRRWREGTLVPFVCGRLRLLGDWPALLGHRRRLRHLGPGKGVDAWQVEDRFWGAVYPD